ncbi:MAG: ATP-binding cassette domain-containing protein [Actinobacteria bacterium]|nr:ATP-binding cassette domain-containing protein [Actinomycetota bacterium]
MHAIEIEGLVKHFGEVVALDGLDLAVPRGSVFGLLGPNGAGKTTAVRILSTLLVPTAGTARVSGHDIVAEPEKVRRLIGLTGQFASVDEELTGLENLVLIGRLVGMEGRDATARGRELLERFDLADAGARPAKTYSGGMRRRLDLAASLVARPPILFLDEPTTGLDPRSRLGMWGVIREVISEGATLLLTTQYLEEADQLTDTIAVIDHGRVIAEGTADALKDQVGGQVVEARVTSPDQLEGLETALNEIAGESTVDRPGRRVTAPAPDGLGSLAHIAQALAGRDIRVADLSLRRPSLDEVFLQITGEHIAEETGSLEEVDAL